MATPNDDSISLRLPITNRLRLLAASSLVIAFLVAGLSIAGPLFQDLIYPRRN